MKIIEKPKVNRSVHFEVYYLKTLERVNERWEKLRNEWDWKNESELKRKIEFSSWENERGSSAKRKSIEIRVDFNTCQSIWMAVTSAMRHNHSLSILSTIQRFWLLNLVLFNTFLCFSGIFVSYVSRISVNPMCRNYPYECTYRLYTLGDEWFQKMWTISQLHSCHTQLIFNLCIYFFFVFKFISYNVESHNVCK